MPLAFLPNSLNKMILFRPQQIHHHDLIRTAFSIFQSISTLRTLSPNIPSTSTATPKPPIKPWPVRLCPKRLVSMIKRQQNFDLALQIFDYAEQFHHGFSHNYETYCSMIEKLSRARIFEEMETLMSQLQKLQLKCGENLFVTVIRNYGIASRPKLAIRTFLRIENFGVERSVRSLNTLLNALIQNKRFDVVHLLFKNCKQKFGIIPNVFTCNILIKALCKKNDLDGASKVLDEISGMGMISNLVTYTTILGGYCSRSDLVGAKKVFDEILDRGWIPDATMYTVLMNGFCKQGRLIEAIKIMDDMEENGIDPNDITYGVMIEALCKEKKSGEALNLLEDMIEKKYVPSSALCCKVIDALCEDGKVKNACSIWKKLLATNCTPDNAISSTLIYWLCKEGKIWEARKLFNEFEKGSIPSVLTYNTLIEGMCERGELQEAGRLWDEMAEKGCVPNVFSYNLLIKGFCNMGKASEGVRVLEDMVDKGCLPNKSTYFILVEGLYESGKGEEVMNILAMATSSRLLSLDTDSWGVFITKTVANSESWRHVLDSALLDTVT